MIIEREPLGRYRSNGQVCSIRIKLINEELLALKARQMNKDYSVRASALLLLFNELLYYRIFS